MPEFRERLLRWAESNRGFTAESLGQWKQVQLQIFRHGIPRRAEWVYPSSIVSVLNVVGSADNLNHMFFTGGGGLDLSSARESSESGCIELNAQGSASILRPKRLMFESFGNYEEWAYFRLECDRLEPSGVYEDLPDELGYEEVTELEPGRYVSRSVWDAGYTYDEDGSEVPLPEGARSLTRWFRGAFVVFAKASLYNKIDSYDGYHDKRSAEEYRNEIEKLLAERGPELEQMRRRFNSEEDD
jgi:serine/threonine-protein kinase